MQKYQSKGLSKKYIGIIFIYGKFNLKFKKI